MYTSLGGSIPPPRTECLSTLEPIKTVLVENQLTSVDFLR